MNDLVTRLTLDLRNDRLLRGLRASGVSVQQLSNNIDRDMRRSDRAVTRFARNARRELGMLDRMTGGVFGNFRGEILALGSAWASIGILKDAAQLEKVLTRMTQTAGTSRRETERMRREYFAIQKMNGVAVEQSRRATDTMLQSGLSMDESLNSTRAIANASAVSHADTVPLAEGLSVAARAFGFDLSKDGVASEKLNKMVLAGDLGGAELEKLSSILSNVGTEARKAGMTFEGTLAFVEQLSHSEPNPEKLSTLAESTLRVFTMGNYRQRVTEQLGINFFTDKGESRESIAVMNDIAKIYQYQKTDQQRAGMLSDVFDITDKDTRRGMGILLRSGALEQLEEKRETIRKGSAGVIEKRLPDSIDNAVDQVSRLKGAMRESINDLAMPINKALSGAIKLALDPKSAGGFDLSGGQLLAGGALGLGGLYAGVQAAKRLPGVGGLLGGIAMGEVLEQTVGVTPVYVVNMPSSLKIPDPTKGGGGKGGRRTSRVPRLPSPASASAGSAPRLAPPDRLAAAYQGLSNSTGWKGWAKTAGRFAGPIAAAGLTGFTVGDLVNQGIKTSDEKLGTSIGASRADLFLKTMAFFGVETAKQTLAIEKAITEPVKLGVDIKIDDPSGRAKVTNVHAPGAEMDVDITGGTMVMP